MINYWWVTRPKRKLTSVPEVVALFAETALNQIWNGQRDSHLEVEEALEKEGLKRSGSRRDQTGGGARTYRAWMESLGLLLRENKTGQLRLTLAGVALVEGEPPVPILKEQVLKYQFPSAFSTSRNVEVHPRFRIRPFRFLLRLLMDDQLKYLTEAEIAKVVIVSAESESDACFESVRQKVLAFRESGDASLAPDFLEKYGPSKGEGSVARHYGHLEDVANTLVNWIEYTQLAIRDSGELRIMDEKRFEVQSILSSTPPFLSGHEDHESFQRRFGLPPGKRKDNRNFLQSGVVTARMIAEQKVRHAFLTLASQTPVVRITSSLVSQIVEMTGLLSELVERVLVSQYRQGALGSFLSNYFQLAFSGRDNSTEFEKATVEIMDHVFGFEASHVGPLGKTPDVLILSREEGYVGIIDNKAYSNYTLNNDHRNRLVHNYIPKFRTTRGLPLVSFCYIAGGFGSTMSSSIQSVSEETGIRGSGIGVTQFITMIEYQQNVKYSHHQFRELLTSNRVLTLADLN